MFYVGTTHLIHSAWSASKDEEFLEHKGGVCLRVERIREVQVVEMMVFLHEATECLPTTVRH